ncbi:IclR family transcriptional regulator [Capillimicrobium parvum]|uniref:HTH-type transcriptional regulator XynR n=1 Tax=Capillimicrobium parvum TaxID=2884022 RepID=A0A9E6XV88_9ACTN|nr:IclR family transcriptional regulator [Capillimicrobium parvum]UGS34402.1 HTH-type transcriptional regulator XynR [Capillimicrobium parvum]
MTGPSRERPAYPIESVDNALRLLLTYRDRTAIRVSEAGEAMGVAPSTAHRLLAMLQYHGFVTQDEQSRAYLAGPALVDLGLAVVGRMDIRDAARPHLEALCRDVGETVHLAVLRDNEVLFVDSVETTKAVRVGSRTGETMPAHCTSIGKALLAELPADRLRELYPTPRIKGRTEKSISTRARLERELEDIRAVGYATNFGESESELSAVGMAIQGAVGTRAAVSISAPVSRLDGEAIRALAGPLGACVEQIGAELYVPRT